MKGFRRFREISKEVKQFYSFVPEFFVVSMKAIKSYGNFFLTSPCGNLYPPLRDIQVYTFVCCQDLPDRRLPAVFYGRPCRCSGFHTSGRSDHLLSRKYLLPVRDKR